METSAKNLNIENADDFNVSDFIYKFIRSWRLFVFLIILTVSLATVYLCYKIPVYQISATLLLKDDNSKIDQASILETLDLFSTKKVVENELVVIKSRDLMKQVVRNLRLYAPISESGRLKSVSGYLKSPVLIEVKHPDSLTETGEKIYFKYVTATKQVTVNNQKYSLGNWYKIGADTTRFIPNPNYLAPNEEKPLYYNLIRVKSTAEAIGGNIEATCPDKQSTIITLTMKDEITKRGEDILNELIRTYNRAGVEDKNLMAENTLSFVEDRLHYVVSELDSVETAMQHFKSDKGIVDVSEQGKIFLGNVASNDQKISEINIQIAVMDQVEKYVSSKDEKMAIAPSMLGVSDPVLLGLLQNLNEFEMQYERLKKTTAENNYILVSLRAQIEKLKPNILENIHNQRNNLLAGRSTLNVNSEKFSTVLKSIPQKEKQLLEISRQQSIKNNIYTYLLQKREETALSFASTVADSRVVENADSTVLPISPKKMLIYGGAVAIALVLGIVIIVIKELLNTNVEFRSDIEKFLSWPVIGEIASDSSGAAIVVNEGVRNIIAEQFRQIRTSLDYLGVNEHRKKILITSSISQEGKSFIATNLAISLALTGKKVVLLEFDIRKPKLSEIFGIKSNNGISSFLIGKTDLETIIKKTEINENLYFIPSGPIPPNPSELLLSPKMNNLFDHLNNEFDYILIDSAPIVPVTDADILTKFCDATLFVVRHEHTPKAQLKRLEATSKVRGLKNAAIIFNGTKERSFGNYKYGYSNGYGYVESNFKPKKSIATQFTRLLFNSN